MISSEQVLEKIQGDKALIVQILKDFDFHDITDKGKEIRCAFEEDGNPNGVHITIDDLRTTYYSKNIHGFYNLLILKSNSEFLEVHNILMTYVDEIEDVEIKPLFGGFFQECEEINIHYYSEKDLESYKQTPSKRFYDDNIFISTQKLFDLRYDYKTNRIVIPWRSRFGELVGATGRINRDDVDENVAKYLALLPFSKRYFLYGLNVSGEYIEEINLAFIFEAEKSVMKSYQHGIRNAVSIGSHSISEEQCQLLSRYCERVIVAFDEGLDEYEITNQKRLLNQYFKKVAYVWDENNEYLPSGSKLSPADLPTSTFKRCLKLLKRLD